jgi:hypothetical protein
MEMNRRITHHSKMKKNFPTSLCQNFQHFPISLIKIFPTYLMKTNRKLRARQRSRVNIF